MSLTRSITEAPILLLLGALTGAMLGPAAAAMSVAVPDRCWPWQQVGSTRWLRGEPAGVRRRLGMALAGAVVLGSLAVSIGWRPAAVAFALMGFVGVILGAIDLEHHRLPDRLTLSGAVGSGVALLLDAAATGDSWPNLLRGLICAGVAFAMFLVMALISPSGMGFGDVKLAALLALHTGWLSWQLAIVAVLAGFLLGGVASLVLVATRRATLRTAIAFGPALLVGAWLAVVTAAAT